ncbi:hypothetical protein MML48_6g00001990 [Holotrichia oblita]|uniref:Uncharacterized protein n=1 Tax=Holotrichia oblita TaxID=644536 RepID=A0ACB9SYZ3_HOLOL|nr:hypothetical protein MML48_6g00001990 [Holotrichia oblita]
MSHIINAFLATEITCIPQVLDRYAGKYYSNTISNGATWVFFMWHILHFIFEESVNPLYKYIYHWIYHDLETPKTKCPGLAAECSLFQPRDDVAFNLKIIRQEIKDREAKMMSLRKPKNRNMLMQTLKCMVVIKKKLKEKKSASSESSDSEDSESDLQTPSKEKNSDSEEDTSELDDDKVVLLAKINNNEESKVVINNEDEDDLDDSNDDSHSKVNME